MLLKDKRLIITPKDDLLFNSASNLIIWKMLIEDGRIDLNWKNSQGETVIHYSCSKFFSLYAWTLMQIMIAAGRYVDVNSQDRQGNTIKQLFKQRDIIDSIEEYEKDRQKAVDEMRTRMKLAPLTRQQRFMFACADGQVGELKSILSLQSRKKSCQSLYK